MEREEAYDALRKLVGQDLRQLAEQHGIRVWYAKGKMNKGWAGQVVERCLGLPINSSRSPNLGSWELKVVPMVCNAKGKWRPKETMAITMIDPVEVKSKSFADSHLYTKLRKLILVTRHRVDDEESSSPVLGVYWLELDGTPLFDTVREDYEKIRAVIMKDGVSKLTARIGTFVQPRTKGQGHGSKSRAFYAKKVFLTTVIESPERFRVSRRRGADCRSHAGSMNASNREQMDSIMAALPANQSGRGRHKCPYCAYVMGYEDALAEIGYELSTKHGRYSG